MVKRGRRVSGTRQIVGSHQLKAAAGEQIGKEIEQTEPREAATRVMQWADIGGRRVRRELVKTLRRQQVSLTSQKLQAESAAARAAPTMYKQPGRTGTRRRSWANRLARNTCGTASSRWSVTLPGIPPALAAYLGLPSASAPKPRCTTRGGGQPKLALARLHNKILTTYCKHPCM
jgi:hypothetical protein